MRGPCKSPHSPRAQGLRRGALLGPAWGLALALLQSGPLAAASTAVLPQTPSAIAPQEAPFVTTPALQDADPAALGLRPPDPETYEAIAALCDWAAARASRESGVPLDVLRAITRTETGRRREGVFAPWPWTINMEGKGVWFDSRAEAIAYAQTHYDRGARSFDMGCFQVNYRWHGAQFPDLAAMMDPLESARYAARFLSALHAESGDWDIAAGHYHSRLPKFADRYRSRFRALRAKLTAMPVPLSPVPPDPAAAPPALLYATLPETPGAVSLRFPAGSGGLLSAARPLFD